MIPTLFLIHPYTFCLNANLGQGPHWNLKQLHAKDTNVLQMLIWRTLKSNYFTIIAFRLLQ